MAAYRNAMSQRSFSPNNRNGPSATARSRRAESRLGHARQCIRSIILKRPSDQVAVSKGIYPSQLAVCGYLGRKARAQ